MELGQEFMMVEGEDVARKAWNLRQKIREFQETFSVLEKVGRTEGRTDRAGGDVSVPQHPPSLSPDAPLSCSAPNR